MSDRRRSRSRERDRNRDRDSHRISHSQGDRNRDRDRDRQRDTNPHRARHPRRSSSRDRDPKRRRSHSPKKSSRPQQQNGSGPAPKQPASEAAVGDAALKEKQRLRQQKMAALLGKQAGTESKITAEAEAKAEPEQAVPKMEPEYWAPWEADLPSDVQPGVRSDIKHDPVSHPAVSSLDAQSQVQMPPSVLKPSVIEAPVPEGDDGVDPLDAFMDAEVMPEVQDREREEKARRDAARERFAQQMATGTIPKLSAILEDSDEEEEPDATVVVPHKKVKLVVGPGGEKIKHIQHKSKCRLQIKKEEKELNRAFGTSAIQAKIEDLSVPQEGRTATIMLFGNARECEVAQAMIEEAIENKEQKAKQRAKEYERKREAKWRNRQMYHMRHTRDYEALGLPIGASKVDVKAAYKKLAVQWHPDKHPEDPEGAKAKFQEVQQAYTALMTTDEDEIIAQLAAKRHKGD